MWIRILFVLQLLLGISVKLSLAQESGVCENRDNPPGRNSIHNVVNIDPCAGAGIFQSCSSNSTNSPDGDERCTVTLSKDEKWSYKLVASQYDAKNQLVRIVMFIPLLMEFYIEAYASDADGNLDSGGQRVGHFVDNVFPNCNSFACCDPKMRNRTDVARRCPYSETAPTIFPLKKSIYSINYDWYPPKEGFRGYILFMSAFSESPSVHYAQVRSRAVFVDTTLPPDWVAEGGGPQHLPPGYKPPPGKGPPRRQRLVGLRSQYGPVEFNGTDAGSVLTVQGANPDYDYELVEEEVAVTTSTAAPDATHTPKHTTESTITSTGSHQMPTSTTATTPRYIYRKPMKLVLRWRLIPVHRKMSTTFPSVTRAPGRKSASVKKTKKRKSKSHRHHHRKTKMLQWVPESMKVYVDEETEDQVALQLEKIRKQSENPSGNGTMRDSRGRHVHLSSHNARRKNVVKKGHHHHKNKSESEDPSETHEDIH